MKPVRQETEVATTGAVHSWTAALTGNVEEATVWVTLYSSGRYLQALRWTGSPLSANSGAPSDDTSPDS